MMQGMRRGFVLLVVGLLLAGCSASVHAVREVGSRSERRMPIRTETLSTRSGCAGPRANPLDYRWPVRPFGVQHPIRGNFGDPRTISAEEFGIDGLGIPGDYSFHNGVDISATPSTPVYAVVSGIVYRRLVDAVFVRAGRRAFQYRHITPAVQTGERVVAGVTVLGRVQFPAKHVHLTEIDRGRVINPALHLQPYADRTAPVVREIEFRNATGRPIRSAVLSREISIVAWAEDRPPLPVPGAWDGFPVTPAVVRWRLLGRAHHNSLPRRTIIDVRRTEPPKQNFWTVYAAGTYQNFPVFEARFYWRYPGRYLYKLTDRPINTRRLANGIYTVQVVATDICGNRGTLTQQVLIDNQRSRRPTPYNVAAHNTASPGETRPAN